MCVICGCFGFYQPDNKKANPIELPLSSISYQITLLNGIAEVQIKQVYVNKHDKYLQLQYKAPISSKSCLHKFVAIFSKRRMEGVIKEKEIAKKQYKEAVNMGKKAALGTKDEENPQMMTIQIGNIAPGEEVIIEISYIEELSLCLNTFYQFELITNHYVKVAPVYDLLGGFENPIKYQSEQLNWSFKLNLRTQRKVKSYKSLTHKILLESKNDQSILHSFVLAQGQKLSSVFKFIYTSEDFELPSYTLGRTDAGSSVMFSLIPKFCKLSLGDAQIAAIQSRAFDVQMDSVQGEYLFLLDRSGSMGGTRIKNAQKALILFLKSLPINTYFNIIGFGTTFHKLFLQSKKNSQQSIQTAISKIAQMDASLGGTNILTPMTQIFKQPIIKGYPRQLFLLTDGQVSNSKQVIDLVRKNVKYTRVNAIGIGADAQKDLIIKCAEKGKGIGIFIDDKQNFSEKIIQLLNDSLTPVISEVSLIFDEDIVESITPNPEKMPYILKNQVVNFYITFKGQLNKPTTISFNYVDSLNKIPYKSQIKVSPDSSSESFVQKMNNFRKIKVLQEAQESGNQLEDHLYYVKIVNKKDQIINLSLKSQILSKHTAFLCIQTELIDGKYQEIKSLGQQKVQIIEIIQVKSLDIFENQSRNIINQNYSNSYAPSGNSFDFFSSSSGGMFGGGMSMNNKLSYKREQTYFDCGFTNSCLDQEQQQSDFSGFSYQPKEETRSSPFSFFSAPKKDNSVKVEQKINKNAQSKSQTFDLFDFEPKSPSKQFLKQTQKKDVYVVDINYIISLQNFDGKWDSLKLIELIFGEDLSNLIEKVAEKNVIVTFLIVRWLQRNYPQAEYKLIIKKGQSWLQKQPELDKTVQNYSQYIK